MSENRLVEGEPGSDVTTAVQARFGDAVPAILNTGDSDPNMVRSMAGRGIVVLHKPLELEILQKCIENLACQASELRLRAIAAYLLLAVEAKSE